MSCYSHIPILPSILQTIHLILTIPSVVQQCWLILLLHPFNDLFPGQPGKAGTRKVNHSGLYCNKSRWAGSGISWTICRSFAPRSRQITMPIPYHSVFTGQMPFLPPMQQHHSTARCVMETVSGLKEPKATYPQRCSSGRTG